MSTILTFDIGNSNAHVGISKPDSEIEIVSLNEFFERSGDQNLGEDIQVGVSQVGSPNAQVEKFLSANSHQVIDLMEKRSSQAYGDMPILYNQNLGQDRLFQAYYLFKTQQELLSRYTLVLVDAGTFTTVDFIDADGLQGGFIFPGNQVYLDSFSRAALLPVMDSKNLDHFPDPAIETLPESTESAIMVGLKLYNRGLYTYIDQEFSERPLAFVVTGGHGSEHWKSIRSLENSSKLLLPYNPHLIHQALAFLIKEK